MTKYKKIHKGLIEFLKQPEMFDNTKLIRGWSKADLANSIIWRYLKQFQVPTDPNNFKYRIIRNELDLQVVPNNSYNVLKYPVRNKTKSITEFDIVSYIYTKRQFIWKHNPYESINIFGGEDSRMGMELRDVYNHKYSDEEIIIRMKLIKAYLYDVILAEYGISLDELNAFQKKNGLKISKRQNIYLNAIKTLKELSGNKKITISELLRKDKSIINEIENEDNDRQVEKRPNTKSVPTESEYSTGSLQDQRMSNEGRTTARATATNFLNEILRERIDERINTIRKSSDFPAAPSDVLDEPFGKAVRDNSYSTERISSDGLPW